MITKYGYGCEIIEVQPRKVREAVQVNMQSCVAPGRLDTGPLKPDGDWPGLFIRGDEAMIFAQLLHHVNKTAKLDGITELEKLLLSSFGPK